MLSHNPLLTKGKILVIDDLADWREMVGGLLGDAGYDVRVAANAKDALRLLQGSPYHVAIVDLRLDEADEDNQEGLILAEQMKRYLPELTILMLTGHANIDAVKQALQPREDGLRVAFDFIEKHEISKLLSKIEGAFINGAKVNPQLKISLDPDLDWGQLQQKIECLQPLDLEMGRQEITDLLQRIFHKAEHIFIKPMKNGLSSGAIVLVTPTTNGSIQQDIVVKFNEREKAERESQNYKDFVESYVGGSRRTQQLNFRATGKLGGIAYSFVGAKATEFQRFSGLYASKNGVELKRVIDNLFTETCQAWYRNTLTANELSKSLSADYKEWLKLDNNKLLSALMTIVERSGLTKLAFSDPNHPAQATILFKERGVKLTNPFPISHAAFAYNGPYAYTHGDLHEGNILVDSYFQTWLIDFYQSGLAHPVRDFALLESAIRFYLQDSGCPTTHLYDWECSLLQVQSLEDEPKANPPLILDAELAKATELVLHIRRLLSQILPEMTLRDYLISLYFHALKVLTLPKKFNDRQRVHALFTAAILADILR